MTLPISSAPRGPSKRAVWIVAVLIALAGAGAIISLKQRWGGHRAVPPIQNEPDVNMTGAFASMRIPEFSLVDQDGAPRAREAFKGRWTILAFTFTNCSTACPIINSHLIRAQHVLAGTPIRTVSISVDPAHDTPAALRAHAEKLGIDTSRWTFLTGDVSTIEKIIAGLRFGLDRDARNPIALPGGGTMPDILHPTKLLLIGPDVTVAAMESGLEWSSVERLIARAKQMLR